MADEPESTLVIAGIGLVIAVAVTMLAWAVTGGMRVPMTTDNCPVEYKAK